MSEIKLSTSKMNAGEAMDFGTKLIGLNAPAPPATPPIPNMATPVADLTTKLTAAQTANNAYEQAKASLPGLLSARDIAIQDLKDEEGLFAKAAAKESKGNATMLLAAGFELVPSAHSPSPGVQQPLNVILSEGKNPGSIGAKCNPDANASTYEWQTTTGDPVTGPYVTFKQTTAAHVTITGLTSGTRVWVRVRAIGTKGEGPWSDPAMKIVP
ncbi:MAG: fibronectin type III domain-containing protein [Chthoniobacteraceae bacterium]